MDVGTRKLITWRNSNREILEIVKQDQCTLVVQTKLKNYISTPLLICHCLYLLEKLNLSKYVTLIIDVTRSMLLKLLGIIKIR